MDAEEEVFVPSGPFLCGRSERDLFAERAEQPAREVVLGAYWIDAHPVTNGRYRVFVEAGGYGERRWWSAAGWAWKEQAGVRGPMSFDQPALWDDLQPVAGVSWYEASAYCAWAGRRLPTGAEWEKAARGTDGRRFPWGDALPRPELCNFDGTLGRTTPIGRYPAGVSPYGVWDMAGNVNNWVRDLHWPGFGAWCVEAGELRDPCLDEALAARLALELDERVDRGGGYLTRFARFEVLGTTYPLGWVEGSRHPWHGFRTVRGED